MRNADTPGINPDTPENPDIPDRNPDIPGYIRIVKCKLCKLVVFILDTCLSCCCMSYLQTHVICISCR